MSNDILKYFSDVYRYYCKCLWKWIFNTLQIVSMRLHPSDYRITSCRGSHLKNRFRTNVFSVFPDDGITWRRQVQEFKGYRLESLLTKDIALEVLQSPTDLYHRQGFKWFLFLIFQKNFCFNFELCAQYISVFSVISVWPLKICEICVNSRTLHS